ncbi:hypothetical protein [Streptomyces sp. NBC_01320]|uniref:hypothetical protein n=1 Tax=Streptomyces sp. NBC_01320 TaxID=2903824 RepID=UPI002E166D4A|nr:hypothetical protein OG395_08485 [Streptomyces sp. NBC_01320]
MESITFPHELVQAQRDWNSTYQALAAPCLRNRTVLRRRLLHLSARIQWHPFWASDSGRSTAARVELRRQARTDSRTAARAG